MPIDAISAAEVGGPEWTIAMPEAPGLDPAGEAAAPDAPQAAQAADGAGFGDLLAEQIGNLQALQEEAAVQSQALATGQAEDISQVVVAVERAQLAMQLAAQLRDRGVEAFQEIFRTQV
jgi:flagellar hook-basal body complex protein FliE